MKTRIVEMREIDGKHYVAASEIMAELGVAQEALQWCEKFFLERDRMNAAVHCAPLRLSPITERVLLALGRELPKQ